MVQATALVGAPATLLEVLAVEVVVALAVAMELGASSSLVMVP